MLSQNSYTNIITFLMYGYIAKYDEDYNQESTSSSWIILPIIYARLLNRVSNTQTGPSSARFSESLQLFQNLTINILWNIEIII